MADTGLEAMTLIIDLVPHLEAGDRTTWAGDQNERPLAELGRRQALALADALGAEPVDALYASPALRCRQSLEPLAGRLGLAISVVEELGEDVWRVPEGWAAGPGGAAGGYSSAFAAGAASAAVERMRREHADGRVVACSHGHVIPAFVAFLIGSRGWRDVAELQGRGEWYRLRFEADAVAIERRKAPPGFPQ